jgi:CheY-like chemotaxis protein
MAGRRILITDDEALFRSSAAESLRARFRGVEVLEAEDGAEALSIMARTPVDVLITDLQMPKLGGIELVARISSHRMPIQIIVVSAHMTDHTRGALDDLGALVCVDKPIDLGVLHEAVERMLAIPRAHVSGVTLAGFVQLLEMEHQTCALRVGSPDGVGTLVFDGGKLVDAWTGELAGDAAALAILAFRECTLDVIGVLRTVTPRVTMPLSFLLLESARRTDEAEPVAGQWEIVSVAETKDEAAAEAMRALGPVEGEAAPAERKAIDEGVARVLRTAMEMEGAIGVALVDAASGEALGTAGGGAELDVALAATGNAEVLRAKRRLMERLGLAYAIEDILITLGAQYHLIRPLNAPGSQLFLYLVIDRKAGNLGLARHHLTKVEASWRSAAAPA